MIPDRIPGERVSNRGVVLNHPNVACVIPGFRNERQVSCNLGAANRELSAEDLAFIGKLFSEEIKRS